MPGIGTVSYTHLDVYKRQTQHRIKAEAVLTLIADMLRAIAEYSKNDRAEFIRTIQETQAAQQTADTVSYTHLDVYKRQRAIPSGRSRARTITASTKRC